MLERDALKESSALRPLEAVQNPGWSAQRHRIGRQCRASRQAPKNSPPEARPNPSCEPPPPRGRLGPLDTRKFQRVAASGKSYELRRVARTARGGGDSRDPTGSQFPNLQPNFRMSKLKKRSLTARLDRDLTMSADATPGGRPQRSLRSLSTSAGVGLSSIKQAFPQKH